LTRPGRIHFFPDSERFARRLARALGAPASAVASHRFPDGETLVRVHTPPESHAVLVRSLHDPDAKLVPVLLAADALRRAGARQVSLVAPYLPYMRQDRVFRSGEPISQRVVGQLIGSAFDAVLTLEAHMHRVTRLGEVVPGRARSISAAPALGEWVRRNARGALLIGPDAESERWVRAVARIAGRPFAVGAKVRRGDARVQIEFGALPDTRRALIVDDVASSGSTLAEAARRLRRRGIEGIEAAVVHAVFAPRARSRIRRAGVRRIVTCDSIPDVTNAVFTARLFAAALDRGRR
jgi:ribose-phosphate pyrophosphokinase